MAGVLQTSPSDDLTVDAANTTAAVMEKDCGEVREIADSSERGVAVSPQRQQHPPAKPDSVAGEATLEEKPLASVHAPAQHPTTHDASNTEDSKAESQLAKTCDECESGADEGANSQSTERQVEAPLFSATRGLAEGIAQPKGTTSHPEDEDTTSQPEITTPLPKDTTPPSEGTIPQPENTVLQFGSTAHQPYSTNTDTSVDAEGNSPFGKTPQTSQDGKGEDSGNGKEEKGGKGEGNELRGGGGEKKEVSTLDDKDGNSDEADQFVDAESLNHIDGVSIANSESIGDVKELPGTVQDEEEYADEYDEEVS